MVSEWESLTLREAGVALIDCDHRTPPGGGTFHSGPAAEQRKLSGRDIDDIVFRHFSRNRLQYGLLLLVALFWAIDWGTVATNTERPAYSLPDAQVQRYARQLTAPNGSPWPSTAGYVAGYPRASNNGLAHVTVDNTKNDSDVFVKLFRVDSAAPYPVRHFFIPAFSKFTLDDVAPGTYDIRYRDLRSGGLSRTESFSLEEKRSSAGVRYSDLTMTLYRVRGGNMDTYGLAENEF